MTYCRHSQCLVQQHAASFIAHTEASTGGELPRFIKEEFDAFLECGILAHGFLRLRCGACGHDKLLAFSCKRRGFCPSCGAGELKIIAAILERAVIQKILAHLGLDPQPPPKGRAREAVLHFAA